MTRIQELLDGIFANLKELTDELQPFDEMLKAAGGKPLAECGASDKIRIAVALLKSQKNESEKPNHRAAIPFECYPSGFRVGDRVRLKHAPQKYNRDQGLCRGECGSVIEPPNPDTWPEDAVQIQVGRGQGGVEADCLEKI